MAGRKPNPQAVPGNITPGPENITPSPENITPGPENITPGQVPPEQPPEAPQVPTAKKPEQYSYRCTERCTWGGHYRKVGEVVYFDKKTDIPHFELIP
jgi:hypothetical protein